MVIETLSLWRRSAFVCGQADCFLAVCDHVLAETGIDPAAPWRGTYHDQAGADAILAEFGGAMGLAAHGMALAGFRRADVLHPGFPVVCNVRGLEAAGIWTGTRVAFMAVGRGLVEMRAPILGCWAI